MHTYIMYICMQEIQREVLKQIAEAYNLSAETEDYKRYVALSFDEIKIKENISTMQILVGIESSV